MNNKFLNKKTRNSFPLIVPLITIIGIGIITIVATNTEPNWNHDWSGITKEIRDSLLNNRKKRMNEFGISLSEKNQLIRRKWIMDNASINELSELTNHSDIEIKMIAYEGLLRRNGFKRKKELTIKAIKDTSDILFLQSSCLGYDSNLGQYLVQNVLLIDEKIPNFLKEKADFGLTKLEEEQIMKVYRKINLK